MQAYRIVDWQKRYEVTSKGHKAKENTTMGEMRSGILQYVRLIVHGHSLSAGYRRMVRKASVLGSMMEMACFGLFIKLLEIAADQEREYRGYILDDRQRPINASGIAELLDIHDSKIQEMLEVLMYEEVKWVEIVEFPVSLQTNIAEGTDVNLGNLPAGPGIPGKSGTLVEAFPANPGRLYETESEDETVTEDNITASIEAEDKVPGTAGNSPQIREPAGDGNARQPQARPPAQASVPVSGSDTVPASDSEEPTASASDSAPVSDSVSQPGPGAGPGAAGPGPLSEQKRFDILRERHKAGLEVMQILKVNPRNNSDTTTISDIYAQLAQRLIGGSPYPLFELSLNTARQCWRGDNPIAMFVAAMKKPPFYYVPKKLSVIPGKFSQDRNTNRNS